MKLRLLLIFLFLVGLVDKLLPNKLVYSIGLLGIATVLYLGIAKPQKEHPIYIPVAEPAEVEISLSDVFKEANSAFDTMELVEENLRLKEMYRDTDPKLFKFYSEKVHELYDKVYAGLGLVGDYARNNGAVTFPQAKKKIR